MDEVVLDLKKGKYDYRKQFIYNDTIVNPAVLYGHNGSGKTSVIKSINNLIQFFSGDLQSGAFYAMPHAFTDNLLTEITLEFTMENNEYIYEVHIEDKNNIVDECLSSNGTEIVYRKDDNVVELTVNKQPFDSDQLTKE